MFSAQFKYLTCRGWNKGRKIYINNKISNKKFSVNYIKYLQLLFAFRTFRYCKQIFCFVPTVVRCNINLEPTFDWWLIPISRLKLTEQMPYNENIIKCLLAFLDNVGQANVAPFCCLFNSQFYLKYFQVNALKIPCSWIPLLVLDSCFDDAIGSFLLMYWFNKYIFVLFVLHLF